MVISGSKWNSFFQGIFVQLAMYASYAACGQRHLRPKTLFILFSALLFENQDLLTH